MTYKFDNTSILIVDDMAPMVSLVSNILTSVGFRSVYTATSADKGFDLFCRRKPDIVLTDWLMEPYTGIDLARRIRTEEASPDRFVPIIMMTGYSHRVRVEQARDVGITEFLVKPFRARDLFIRIEQLVERPRQFVEAREFFGPDRRRRRKADIYEGPRRREEETFESPSLEADSVTLLKDLHDQVKRAGLGKPKSARVKPDRMPS